MNYSSALGLGGLNAGQVAMQTASGLHGLQQQRQQAGMQQQAQQAQQRQQARLQELLPLVKAGDYDATIEMSTIDPDMSNAINKAKAGMNDLQKTATADWIAGYQTAPDKEAFLDQDSPLDIDDKFREMQPEQREAMTRIMGAQLMPKEMFTATFGTQQGAGDTSNMQDFARYQELLGTNPEQAALFANQVGITQKPRAEQGPTQAMQNFDKWSSMPDGPEKDAFSELVGISKAESPKAAKLKAEKIDLLSTKIQTANDTLTTIDEILENPAVDKMFGLPSAFPTIPGSEVADLDAIVEQFKNQLTLENLDKMSGVLTDKDIAVLSSAASGIEKGMSPNAFRRQANKIKAVLKRGITKNKRQLNDPQNVSIPESLEKRAPTESNAVNWGDLD